MSFGILKWKTIKYTEERGLLGMFDNWFGISNEYYGGVFIDPIIYNIDFSESYKKIEKENGVKVVSYVAINPEDPNNYFDLYSRTKKGVFDPISSICSLALTVYNGFIFVFCGYYSNNFDNYKIVEKVLSKNKKNLWKWKISTKKMII